MKEVQHYIDNVLQNMPQDWLRLTTHRLDIYNESLAKTEFLEGFEDLFNAGNADLNVLRELPTAFDYIRLGHPLSSVLEWKIAKIHNQAPESVISFSSQTAPILAILRKNLLEGKNTLITFTDSLPGSFDSDLIRTVYGYSFETKLVDGINEIPSYDGKVIFLTDQDLRVVQEPHTGIDFIVSLYDSRGSIVMAHGSSNEQYIGEIQHVRRRETIAMTPADCLAVLKSEPLNTKPDNVSTSKSSVQNTIRKITDTNAEPLIGSSGLSIQYAITMGLIHEAGEKYPEKEVRIVVPTNCYGGTNDQARRIAACLKHVEVVDLHVDGDSDMVNSIDSVLTQIAAEDAVPLIIAEIPTNPRVEVPDLDKLKDVLSKKRSTQNGSEAIAPVFILDQTFCPNIQFLSENGIFSPIRTIAYVSGSKFPSGGKCTAGYCVANQKAEYLLPYIAKHLKVCDNEATSLQLAILAEQMPAMNQRIQEAYLNTREFVSFIEQTLPAAKINFVSEELAEQGFTPSVFSLDLPTKGDTEEARETYKRELNQKLIDLMISEIPNESKYCVSYGQLKGCYWTIPATSTQGTTKESDKDYIARVALSADMDLLRHKEIFSTFVNSFD